MRLHVVVAPVLVVVLLAPHAVAGATDSSTTAYAPPVDGIVVDGFREPAGPYGPGNRGLEYALDPGTVVGAAAGGEVVFAGSVAGSRHVTIRHPDGLRTSYSFLDTVAVAEGVVVRQGDPVGTSGRGLHFGARDPSGRYLDPVSLFDAQARPHARLVPGVEEGATALHPVERAGFLRVALERAAPAWITDARARRLWLHYLTELRPEVRAAHVADALARLRAQRERCTAADVLPEKPAGRRVLVLVAGLGSTSDHASVDDVDAVALGVAPADVVRFSYAGGRVPDATDHGVLASIDANPYDADASRGDLRLAADRLEQLLVDVARASPGVPIDVVAHSQGGVVARLAIAHAGDRGRLPVEVATLATVASPLDGVDLATAADAAARSRLPVPSIVEAAGFGVVAPSIQQMSEVSDLADELRRAELPARVGRVSIAARGDLVVPTPRTMADGFPSAIVDVGGLDAHSSLPGSPDTTRELRLVRAGAPPTCTSAADDLGDLLVGEAVSWATDAVGAAALASASGS